MAGEDYWYNEMYGMGDSPLSDFWDPGYDQYTGPNFDYTGEIGNTAESPLYGGPGWIHPTGSGDLQDPYGDGGLTGGDWEDAIYGAGGGLAGSSPQSQPYTPPGYSNTRSTSASNTRSTGAPGSGSSYESYGSRAGMGPSSSSPQLPQFNPRGTGYTPSSSSQWSAPTLPAPSLGKPGDYFLNKMKSLTSDPSQVLNDPVYQFLQSEATRAGNRSAAAKGMRLSGNTLAAANERGGSLARDYIQRLFATMYAPGAQAELANWQGPANAEVAKYGASRGSAGTSVGANPGTAGEYAAADFMPYMLQYLNRLSQPSYSPMSSMAGAFPVGAYAPRLQEESWL